MIIVYETLWNETKKIIKTKKIIEMLGKLFVFVSQASTLRPEIIT
jgi:hypothetical protein